MVLRTLSRNPGKRAASDPEGMEYPSLGIARGPSDNRQQRGWRKREGGKRGIAPAFQGTLGREGHGRRSAAEIPGVVARWAIAPAPGTRRSNNRGIRRRWSRPHLGLVRGCGALGTFPGPCASRRRRSTPTRTGPAGMRPGLGGRGGTSPGTLHGATKRCYRSSAGTRLEEPWDVLDSGLNVMKEDRRDSGDPFW